MIREALKLYEHAVNQYLEGAKILSRSKDGKEESLLYTESLSSEATTMTDQALEALAIEFLDLWESFQDSPYYNEEVPFQNLAQLKKFIDLGFIASHGNPREGEYALRYEYVGVIFFTTDTGELVFTEQGLPFAKKCADIFCEQKDGRMQVIKIEALYPKLNRRAQPPNR